MNKEIKDYGEAYEALQNIIYECNRLKMYFQKEGLISNRTIEEIPLSKQSNYDHLVSSASLMIKGVNDHSRAIDTAFILDLAKMNEEEIENILMNNETCRYTVEHFEDYSNIISSSYENKIKEALDAVNERLGESKPLQSKSDYYSEEDFDTMRAVLKSVMYKPYSELNSFMGSETIQRAATLRNKMEHEEYCEKRGMKYEDMTEDDFEMAAEEKIRQEELETEYDDYE